MASLQWALIQSGETDKSHSRGNKPLADQINKPQWLSKSEYLCFCKIRAFPHIQFRNLMIAILDRSLQLESFSVHTLIRQTLHQIGTISIDRNNAAFEWKVDIFDERFSQRDRSCSI